MSKFGHPLFRKARASVALDRHPDGATLGVEGTALDAEHESDGTIFTHVKTKGTTDRLTVFADVETLTVWSVTPKRKAKGQKRLGRILHYREAPAFTPTGGRYTSRRLTVRTNDGRKWVGQFKSGEPSIVIMRPASS